MPLKFTYDLKELETRDHEAAKKIHEAREANVSAKEAFEKE